MKDNIQGMHFKHLQNDDIKEFNALYSIYHSAIYCNVLKITRNFVVTEDIVQEVFISLWEKRHSLNQDQEISGWLFVVSYNRSISYLKRKLQESLVLAKTSLQQNMEEAIDTADAENLINGQITLLEKAIEQLSPQKRKVFELCKLQRKTYEEAGKELMLSKHTVKEYLASAIISIKDFIKKHPEYAVMLVCALVSENYFS